MNLPKLKTEYVNLRTLVEHAKDRYVQTKDMRHCMLARSLRAKARVTQQEICKIEDRILVKKGQ